MSLFREIVEGTARKEMKQRVDQILEANAELRKSLDRLSDFFDSMSEGGNNSRLIGLLEGVRTELKVGIETIRADEEKLVETLQDKHFKSIDRLLKFLDKRL